MNDAKIRGGEAKMLLGQPNWDKNKNKASKLARNELNMIWNAISTSRISSECIKRIWRVYFYMDARMGQIEGYPKSARCWGVMMRSIKRVCWQGIMKNEASDRMLTIPCTWKSQGGDCQWSDTYPVKLAKFARPEKSNAEEAYHQPHAENQYDANWRTFNTNVSKI